MVLFLPFFASMVYRVIKLLPSCSKITPASCGWEWMTDYIYSKMGVSVASPNQSSAAWAGSGWLRTLKGTFGRSVQANRENVCVSAISECRRSFLNQVSRGT